MKVLQLPAWYFDQNGRGGGLFVKELAEALQTTGVVDSDILYGEFEWKHRRSQVQWSIENGVDVLRAQGFALPRRQSLLVSYWMLKYCRLFERYLKKKGLPDVIHAHSLWGAVAAMAIGSEFKIPFIYTEHLGKWTNPAYRLPRHHSSMLRRVLEEAAAVTGTTERMLDVLMQNNKDSKMACIPNIVNTDVFAPVSKNNSTPDGRFNIISIGDPWHTKGLDVLLHALGQAQKQTGRKLHLTLVDTIPGKERHLYPIIRQYGLERQVRFMGPMPHTELAPVLAAHDVLVSASREESFGTTMVEALACGIPVIASATAGGETIVQPTTGLMVPVENAGALADAILKMAGGQFEYDAKILRDHALSTYSRQAVVARWLALYHQVLRKT